MIIVIFDNINILIILYYYIHVTVLAFLNIKSTWIYPNWRIGIDHSHWFLVMDFLGMRKPFLIPFLETTHSLMFLISRFFFIDACIIVSMSKCLSIACFLFCFFSFFIATWYMYFNFNAEKSFHCMLFSLLFDFVHPWN